MAGQNAPVRRGRVSAPALRRSGLDALIGAVVLATATGFGFLGERHARDADPIAAADLLVALEVVLIPLALAAMVVAARGQRWRDLGLRATIGGARGALATAGAAACLFVASMLQAPATALADPALVLMDPILVMADPALVLAGPVLALAEELLRRSFLLNELAAILGRGGGARAAAVAILAMAEALAHAPAGVGAALTAGAADATLGAAYLAAGRALWSPVAARALAHVGLTASLGG